MKKPKLLIIGAGGHARACIDVIEQEGLYQIGGLIGLQQQLHDKILGYEVIGVDNDLPVLVKEYQHAFIALGQIKSATLRISLYERALGAGFDFPVLVAPTAYVSRFATLGPGTIVMNGVIVNTGARIGKNCILNSRALIEHDVIIGDHCHISTGSILNGDVSVGEGSFIGSGSVLKQGVTVGTKCIVGMGAIIRHGLDDQKQFIGEDLA